MSRTADFTSDRQQTVCIVAARQDQAIAEQIAHGLRGMGVTISETSLCSQPRDSAVVVLSRSALANADWAADLSRHDAARLIPVAVGSIDPASIPGSVRQLNWIPWNEDDGILHCCTAIFAALHSDLTRYQLHRALAAEAETWRASEQSPELLIQDRTHAREAQRHLTDAATDPLARSTPTIEAFVAASVTRTGRTRRKRRKRWTRRSLAVVFVVFTAVVVLLGLRADRRDAFLGFLASEGKINDYQPGRVALLSAGALLQGDPSSITVGKLQLRDVLSRNWSDGVLGTKYGGPLIAAMPVDDGSRILAVDYRGLLVSWDVASGLAQWRRHLAHTKLTALDATPDGARVAALTGDDLALAGTSPWNAVIVRLPSRATRVALAPSDGVAAVAGDDGIIRTVELGPGHAVHVRMRGTAVLALRQTSDGHALALVRQGPHRVALINAATGAGIGKAWLPASNFESGGIDSDGAVAITVDRQILYAPHGMRLRPTGQAVPDAVEVLQPLPGRRVAFGDAQFGVQLLDISRGVPLGTICSQLPAVVDLRVATDGDRVACTNGWMVDLWSTRALSPVRAPRIIGVGKSLVVRREGARIAGDSDGYVYARIETPAGERRLSARIARGAVSIVSLLRDGQTTVAAAGTRTGEVTELLMSPRQLEVVSRWNVPDGSPIVEVGWSANGRMLLARTSKGDWWSRPSCAHCGSIVAMLEEVRERTHGCYTSPASETLTGTTKRLLGLSPCKSPPDPIS